MWTTNPSLLMKVKAGDEVSWRDFYRQYQPFAYKIGARHKLNPEECEELVQRSMMAMFLRSRTFVYDSSKGKFRGYLARLVRNQLVNILREKAQREDNLTYAGDIAEYAEQNAFEEEFARDFQQFELDSALAELRLSVSPRTYEAFQMSALQGRKASDVAAALGMSESAVYVYKKRCQDKLQRILTAQQNADADSGS